MAYNQFKKLSRLRDELGLKDIMEKWVPAVKPFPAVSATLIEALEEASNEALTTEKAKSEYIVVPVLKELSRRNRNKFSVFSGFEFNVDKDKGLAGYCDFLISSETKRAEITAPVFCLIEAKDGEIDKGYAQCGAEMYAAQIFNEQRKQAQKAVYGCVTNAFSWCFMKLEGKNLYIDTNYVPLTFDEPQRVLAVLQWILDQALKNKQ